MRPDQIRESDLDDLDDLDNYLYFNETRSNIRVVIMAIKVIKVVFYPSRSFSCLLLPSLLIRVVIMAIKVIKVVFYPSS